MTFSSGTVKGDDGSRHKMLAHVCFELNFLALHSFASPPPDCCPILLKAFKTYHQMFESLRTNFQKAAVVCIGVNNGCKKCSDRNSNDGDRLRIAVKPSHEMQKRESTKESFSYPQSPPSATAYQVGCIGQLAPKLWIDASE